jgi:hypothetical protein
MCSKVLVAVSGFPLEKSKMAIEHRLSIRNGKIIKLNRGVFQQSMFDDIPEGMSMKQKPRGFQKFLSESIRISELQTRSLHIQCIFPRAYIS